MSKKEEFREDIRQEFGVEGDDFKEQLFDALEEILGDDLDGVWSEFSDAEMAGLL